MTELIKAECNDRERVLLQMKILILGDVHGEFQSANKLIRKVCRRHPGITHIVQVGDLGDHWPKSRPRSYTRWNPDTNLPIHWLDGNHDNHGELQKHGKTPNRKLIYQPRGSVLEIDGYRMMFFGGGTSIDRDYRLKQMSMGSPTIWWREETITREEFERALAQEGPIHAVFSHERPDNFPFDISPLPIDFGRSDRIALGGIWERFRPSFWFFGHYHHAAHGTYEGTEWTLCPMVGMDGPMKFVIWDGEKVERSWEKSCTEPNSTA